MLKLFGACLVVCGCSGLGWYAVMGYATRIHMLGEVEQALYFLYGEIEYSGSDMIELLDKLSLRGGYFGSFWSGMAECLQKCDGQRFSEHWQQEIKKIPEIRNLKEEDLGLFLEVGENLGNMDRYTQLHTLEIFQERLHSITGQARAEYREKAKVSMVVSVTAGCLLALLLI
ncbi:hypothetical protein D7V86_22580 [bacterium D16-51]|nr:hypothetical protein D7V96_11215 [bacterium D16-59]RKI54935.1 hypothetical protein D7V86_22580 [bacterium D16-51]